MLRRLWEEGIETANEDRRRVAGEEDWRICRVQCPVEGEWFVLTEHVTRTPENSM